CEDQRQREKQSNEFFHDLFPPKYSVFFCIPCRKTNKKQRRAPVLFDCFMDRLRPYLTGIAEK
ncbi:MAG: hypothetical protein IJT07_01900, partial [Oscillospiraceae bacterium]|nr:hypothetical protein [Oscillospiraceae bacterium]